jgi:hypothetical protein
MKLLVFRALWGMTGPFEEQIERIAAAGYEGVDGFLGASDLKPDKFTNVLNSRGLKLNMGVQIFSAKELEPTLKKLAEYNPMLIGVQSGRDSMTHEEGCAFFEEALRLEQALRIPIAHETHRGKLFFTPWDTAFYLRQFPTLKVLADISHFVNVCERLPEDQQEALDLIARNTVHIHGRVGYEEGPQVPDPSAPEYASHLAWHEKQWKKMIENRRKSGAAVMTFTPEYGPPGYLHTLPHTNVPVADLWQVCLWAAQRARQQLAPFAEGDQ